MNLCCMLFYVDYEVVGGCIIDFGGWVFFVQYIGIIEEYWWVWDLVGFFDVLYMGEVFIWGVGVYVVVQYLVINDVDILVGKVQYMVMCQLDGGIVDDFIVY